MLHTGIKKAERVLASQMHTEEFSLTAFSIARKVPVVKGGGAPSARADEGNRTLIMCYLEREEG